MICSSFNHLVLSKSKWHVLDHVSMFIGVGLNGLSTDSERVHSHFFWIREKKMQISPTRFCEKGQARR